MNCIGNVMTQNYNAVISEAYSNDGIFPNNYVVIKAITTGLDTSVNSLLEVAAIRYVNGQEFARFSELIKPNDFREYDDSYDDDYILTSDGRRIVYIDEFRSKLNSISNEMLNNARSEAEVIKDLVNFVGKDMLVGQNTGFDMNFLYDAVKKHLGISFVNPYVSIDKIARRMFPDLWHYRLGDICKCYDIRYSNIYRALDEALIINMIYKFLYEDFKYMKVRNSELSKMFISNSRFHRDLRAKDIKPVQGKTDPDNLFYNRHVCITGKLEKMKRKEAFQYLADIGGYADDELIEATEFLVQGNNEYNMAQLKGRKSRKLRKAEEAILKGRRLEIISENTFYEMLGII